MLYFQFWYISVWCYDTNDDDKNKQCVLSALSKIGQSAEQMKIKT